MALMVCSLLFSRCFPLAAAPWKIDFAQWKIDSGRVVCCVRRTNSNLQRQLTRGTLMGVIGVAYDAVSMAQNPTNRN